MTDKQKLIELLNEWGIKFKEYGEIHLNVDTISIYADNAAIPLRVEGYNDTAIHIHFLKEGTFSYLEIED